MMISKNVHNIGHPNDQLIFFKLSKTNEYF